VQKRGGGKEQGGRYLFLIHFCGGKGGKEAGDMGGKRKNEEDH